VIDVGLYARSCATTHDMHRLMDQIEAGLLDAWRVYRLRPTRAHGRAVSEAITGWTTLWLDGGV
jgi:hypothetical protein